MPVIDHRPLRLYGLLFALGVAAGGATLAVDLDETSAGAGVATANWVHVGLAVAALAAAVAARGRLLPFLRAPVTADGWSALLGALAWRGRPLVLRPLAFLAALLMAYTPLRAGQQVLGGLDPDFTRDAWGGPSYLGAMAAHYLDGLLIFLAAATVVRATAGSRVRRPVHAGH
jgi:hypothetical protein